MSPHPPKIVLEIIADNQRSRDTIEFAIERHGKGKMAIGQGNNSLLAVVDCDQGKLKEELGRYHRRYPRRPLVLMLSAAKDCELFDDSIVGQIAEVIIKPVKIDTLLQAIERCAARLSESGALGPPATPATPGTTPAPVSTPASSPPPVFAAAPTSAADVLETTEITLALPGGFSNKVGDIDLNDSTLLDNNRVFAGKLLLGRLKDAIPRIGKTEVPLLAELEGRPLFRFQAAAEHVALLIDQAELPSLATRTVSAVDFVLRPDHPAHDETKFQSVLSCEALLWRLALLTYRGLIPEGTRPLDPVYLAHWPNMTRLDAIPDGLRIAALWSRMPVDLGRTAHILSIPQRHVFLFYAAASTIGLAGAERRASNLIFEPALPQEAMPHKFLNRLARYLSNGDHESAA